ncbi:hypothetical protein GPALN_012146 [Globodera pallida]|nr:hypothetical protein GPALN_012146 [Globodera pallida]
MRAFEQAVCGQFRQIEEKFGQIANQLRIQDTADRVRELDSSIKELENITESDTFQMYERLFDVDGEGRVILLEFEQEESSPQWMEDGHSQEHEQLPGEQNDAVNNDGREECRIMVSDPFLGGISPLEGYDGNPTISFSRWVAKLEDMLSLYPQLTEPQRLSRLRILLKGQARAEFDAMDTPPTDLSAALDHLKRKFENENTRSIARQTMAPAVAKHPANVYMIKAGRPINYSNAYEIAQHFELLLATKRSSQVSVADSVAELSNQVEALAIRQHQTPHQKGVDRRTCFYCRRTGSREGADIMEMEDSGIEKEMGERISVSISEKEDTKMKDLTAVPLPPMTKKGETILGTIEFSRREGVFGSEVAESEPLEWLAQYFWQ